MLKTAVFVSGGGTNLQALIDAGLPLALVVARKDVPALDRAQRAGIETLVIGEDFESKALAALQARDIKLIVLAGFLTILSGDFLRAFPGRVVNVHPSLIPAFCGKGYYGLRVHEAALARGVKVTGATVHLVNDIPDGGEILAQKAVDVLPDDTPQTLQRRVMEQAEWVLLPRAVQALMEEE